MHKIVLEDPQPLCKELEPELLEKAHKNIHGIYSWQLKVNTYYADILFKLHYTHSLCFHTTRVR